jgi:PAS domain S-box-containing protein
MHSEPNHYKTIFENAPFGIFLTSQSGKLIEANQRAIEIFGYESIEEVSLFVTNLERDVYANPSDRKWIVETIAKTKEALTVELKLKKKGGEIFDARVTFKPVNVPNQDEIQIIGMFDDISQQKKAEETIRQSEELFETVFSLSPFALVINDIDGKYLKVNEAFEKISGFSANEVIGKTTVELGMIADENFTQKITGELIENGFIENVETETISRDGAKRNTYYSSRIIHIKGKPAVLTATIDITGLKLAEEALRMSEQKARAVLDQSFQFIGLMTTEGILIDANKSSLELAGVKAADVLNKPFFDTPWWTHSKQEQDKLKAAIPKAARGEHIRFETSHIDKEGNTHFIDFSLKPVKDENNRVIYLIPEGHNITLLKQSDEAIKKSGEKLRSLFSAMRDVVIVLDANGRYLEIAPTSTDQLYKPSEQMLGKTMHEVLPRELADYYLGCITEVLQKGAPMALEYQMEISGRNTWFSAMISPYSSDSVILVAHDITDRRQAREALQASEARLREIGNNLPGGMIYQIIMPKDSHRYFTYLSSGVETMHGYTADDILANAMLLYQQVHPEDVENLLKQENKAIQGLTVFDEEARFILKSGEVRWRRLISRPRLWGNQGIIADGIEIDITDRKLAEEALRQNQEMQHMLIAAIPDMILQSDLEGNILYANDMVEKITGITPADYFNKNRKAQVHPDDIGMVREKIVDLLSSDKIRTELIENRFIDASGCLHWFSGTISKLDIGGKLVLQTVSRDITEKKKTEQELINYKNNLELLVKERTEELAAALEELRTTNDELQVTNDELHFINQTVAQKNEELNQTLLHLKETQQKLIQSEKMASLGTLTAGVAHEINNPLNFLVGAQLGLENYFNEFGSADKTNTDSLQHVITVGIERISGIVKGLNQFSRSNDQLDEDCYLHQIIDNCLVMLHNKLKHKAQVQKNYFDGQILIKGNVGKLHQVFVNILDNAIQAIETEGIIKIKTALKANKVHITIEDNGMGIAKHNLSKITDPFFTTKDPGKGTGLGLSISYSIIKDHNGSLEFESEPGKGTKVILTLPVKA